MHVLHNKTSLLTYSRDPARWSGGIRSWRLHLRDPQYNSEQRESSSQELHKHLQKPGNFDESAWARLHKIMDMDMEYKMVVNKNLGRRLIP